MDNQSVPVANPYFGQTLKQWKSDMLKKIITSFMVLSLPQLSLSVSLPASIESLPASDVNLETAAYQGDAPLILGMIDYSKISYSTDIRSAAASKVFVNKFTPGIYKNAENTVTCIVSATEIFEGRVLGNTSCLDTDNHLFSANWLIDAIPGHPYEHDLRKAGIDKIAGYQKLAWGKAGYTNNNYFGCIGSGDIVSATQDGNAIQISGYNKGNSQVCGATLIKQQ